MAPMDFLQALPAPSRTAPRRPVLPLGSDAVLLAAMFLGVLILYLPTCWSLSQTVWRNSDQSQGPLMLAASLWLFYDRREQMAALPSRPADRLGAALLGLGLLMYVVGRSQSIWLFEVGSLIVVVSALLLWFKGYAAWRVAWFAVFILVFMVPLPGPLVAAVTAPLKAAVSWVAASLLFALGYPVSRAGVVLTIGPYLILVADACAGLTSMFSLEAVGLLYLSVVRHPSRLRNLLLSVSVVPIAFCANVLRVIALVLITYHFGDAAGRGFLHGFAGLLLYLVALLLLVGLDRLIGASRSVHRQVPR